MLQLNWKRWWWPFEKRQPEGAIASVPGEPAPIIPFVPVAPILPPEAWQMTDSAADDQRSAYICRPAPDGGGRHRLHRIKALYEGPGEPQGRLFIQNGAEHVYSTVVDQFSDSVFEEPFPFDEGAALQIHLEPVAGHIAHLVIHGTTE